MKAVSLALAAAAAVALVACGGGGSNEPLTLEERVASAQDAPGSEPDPVEKPVSVSGANELISKLGDRFINPTSEDVARFRSSDFVRAVHRTRFIPEEAGGAHTRTAPHIFSLVMQFKTDKGADTAVDFLHTDSLRPCPETCATQTEEFDPGFDDAKGSRRYATAESIQATGDTEIKPYDRYEIDFADGVFAYRIELQGPPGTVSEDQASEIAESLYSRVRGAPAKS